MKKKNSLTNETSPYDEAVARGDMYRFLSAVFLNPPSHTLLERIADGELLQELSRLFGRKAVGEPREYAAAAHPDEDLEFLKQEYMDLFAVPAGRYVFPFEDIYLGKAVDGKQGRGPLLGERAIAVTRAYREAGAEMDGPCKELPTHIGVEIGFMSFLCEREALAILDRKGESVDSDKYRHLQAKFLGEHLNQWFPPLNRSIQKNTKSQFYRGLGLITEAFLAQDAAGLLAGLHSKRKVSQKGDGKNGSAKYLQCGTQCRPG